MLLNVPFSRFECDIDIENDTFEIISARGKNVIDMWELRQRSIVRGQGLINERIEFRDAVLSALGIAHRPEDAKDKTDYFKNHQLSVGYQMKRPLAEYAKKRREYLKSKRKKK